MATEPTPQRAYRAACPNCGAPVEFRSAASAFAVCSYCHSTLLRDGDALRRIGQSAELFDDHSPLQLGASGKYQGAAFTLVGRLQIRYAEGSWNEWHALFQTGPEHQKSGWLSEDNGQYVIGFNAPPPADLPTIASLRVGEPRRFGAQVWSVASIVRAKLGAAEGELPFTPDLQNEYPVADLRNTSGEVATLEEPVGTPPRWSIGRAVSFGDLALTGLAGESEKSLASRGIECPNCGFALEPKLSTTQSLVCPQCKSVVNISKGAGADIAFYKQGNPGIDGAGPQIPLGSTGTLALGGAAKPWQVVGYVERCELPEDAGDERSYWREYLLYNRQDGFAFLVDANDGWSWSRPIAGVPESAGEHAKLNGVQYRPLYTYTGIVTYVLGEFYWRLKKDERTLNTDYQGIGGNGAKRLNREATGNEVVWSSGETLDASVVATAFRLAASQGAALQRDTSPLAGTAPGSSALVKGAVIFFLILLIIFALSRCGGDDCGDIRQTYGASSAEYQQCARSGGSGFRTGGGSFGGFSSGGSHK